MKFEIELLSKGQADCFLVMIANDQGDECNILIDGNREGKKSDSFKKIVERIAKLEKLDCIVVTHIDNDHLGGILSLFDCSKGAASCINKQLKECIIVYNNVTKKFISYKQAERFEKLIRTKKVINSFSHKYQNGDRMLHFLSKDKRRIFLYDESKERNVYVTFLNPDKAGAREVNNDYKKYKYEGKKGNAKLINKNSIVLIIEYQGKSVLFTGDAYSGKIENAIEELRKNELPYPINKIDIIKVPHHGAEEYNENLASFSEKVECDKLIITGRSIWDKKHPSKELLEKLYKSLSSKLEIYTEVELGSIDPKFKGIQSDSKKIKLL
ncbi:ComEC/Rec2 family competence protein [Oceanirhabdus sp. W0125-5]|uniref:ComEC/Rec2 family competence protein n=1 Tax=Oceanirhabdus sp. W0125-5 TaxID=2999116 RepID=UPI0022F32AD7|nr:MBL fold metallo-hydrolase [Oceanirhabdus sp. W0125-5]WBW98848.1 MBL fold metallo-hydrolase [Oceanirhabdus sp. W0125-5]